jgi:hypothetical protein
MKKFIFKLKQIIKSRTFWTVVIMACINTITPLRNQIPAEYIPFIDAGLALLATLFHVFPSADYTKSE